LIHVISSLPIITGICRSCNNLSRIAKDRFISYSQELTFLDVVNMAVDSSTRIKLF